MSSSAISRLVLLLSKKKDEEFDGHSDQAPLHDGDSDEELLARVSSGDREALAQLFRRYARLVRGIAYKIVRDASEADDLLQDVFLVLHNKARMFNRSKGTARSWIVQIVYSRAIDRRRYLTTRQFYTQVALDNEALDILDQGEEFSIPNRTFGRRVVTETFKLLSDNQKQTLRLYFFEGYTFDEIADKLGQSSGNVRHHYYRGLERLRRALTGERHSR